MNRKTHTGKDRSSQRNSKNNNDCSSGKPGHVPDAEPVKETKKKIHGFKQAHQRAQSSRKKSSLLRLP
jgi:hypothetical protein